MTDTILHDHDDDDDDQGGRGSRGGVSGELSLRGDGVAIQFIARQRQHFKDCPIEIQLRHLRGRFPGHRTDARDHFPGALAVGPDALVNVVGGDAKPPRRLPSWLARLLAGEAVVVMSTEARGASNAKAKRELGWEPRTSFEDLVRLMVDADLQSLQAGAPFAEA
jgi:nucleoside-diphosphate-sugar epimerase